MILLQKKSRTYYLLNYSNNQTITRLSFHFREHRLSENLEDELVKKELNPLIELTNKILSSIDNDNLSVPELQKVTTDLIIYFLVIHKKRLEVDFNLVRNGIDFTRTHQYDVDIIRSVIDYFSKYSESIFDILIRIMRDPVTRLLQAPKAKVRGQKSSYRWTDLWNFKYINLWNILAKENRLPQGLR
jgi:hypothetical protein